MICYTNGESLGELSKEGATGVASLHCLRCNLCGELCTTWRRGGVNSVILTLDGGDPQAVVSTTFIVPWASSFDCSPNHSSQDKNYN